VLIPLSIIHASVNAFTVTFASTTTGNIIASAGSGATGATGATGAAATIAAGTTTTGNEGTNASVVNSGSSSAATFDFTIPRGNTGVTGNTGATGATGAAATVAVGTTTTLAAGSSNTVTNSGTTGAAVLNFGLAAGATGSAATVAVGTTTTLTPGSSNTVTNSGTSAAAVLDFSLAQGLAGDLDRASIQTVTGAKTFGAAGGVGKLIIAGNTSGATILNASAIAGSGTVTLPTSGTLTVNSGAATTAYRSIVRVTTDVINSNSTANTLQDVTGLSFPMTIGVAYHFEAMIMYTAAATTVGSRWAINCPTLPSFLAVSTATVLTNNTAADNGNQVIRDGGVISTGTSTTAGNIARVTGVIKAAATETMIIRFASEVANSAITVKYATLEWW